MSTNWRPYEPRSIRAAGLREIAGWQMKCYEVNCARGGADWLTYQGGMQLLTHVLPQPAVAANRAGIGLLIAHPGVELNYLVGCWWDNQNELVTRVFVCAHDAGAWKPSGDEYSFCVWDLEVIWFERNAWIECMLGRGLRDPAAYLSQWLTVEV